MKSLIGIFFLLSSVNVNANERKHTPVNNFLITSNQPQVSIIKLSTGVTLEYAEQGNKNGVPVILLHGITDSWKSYEAVLPHFPSSLHVFSISQRGHGNSSKDCGSYMPEDFAKDVAAFIEQKKLGAAVIVGHSMGSTNAQCFAANYPSLTKALVLVGAFADFDKPVTTELKKMFDELKDPIDSSFVADFQTSTIVKPIPPTMLNGFIAESRKVPSQVWKGVAAGWAKADYCSVLKGLNKPVLILWGEKDSFCPKDDQQKLNRVLKNSRLIVYEGIGHALHWEEPGKFVKDLLQFFTAHNLLTK